MKPFKECPRCGFRGKFTSLKWNICKGCKFQCRTGNHHMACPPPNMSEWYSFETGENILIIDETNERTIIFDKGSFPHNFKRSAKKTVLNRVVPPKITQEELDKYLLLL